MLSLNLSANVYSQQNKVSLDLKEVTLEEFIEAVKQQTGVNFLYNASLFEGAGTVSVNVKKEPLSKVLEETLGQKGYAIDYRDEVVVILKQEPQPFVPSMAQAVRVSGKVVDEDGQPLPGVSVVLKGTTTGVATDVNGEFILMVPKAEGAVLVFSFVGMKTQELPVTANKPMHVVMVADSEQMEEVVVTGIQTIEKGRATGSCALLDQKDMEAV